MSISIELNKCYISTIYVVIFNHTIMYHLSCIRHWTSLNIHRSHKQQLFLFSLQFGLYVFASIFTPTRRYEFSSIFTILLKCHHYCLGYVIGNEKISQGSSSETTIVMDFKPASKDGLLFFWTGIGESYFHVELRDGDIFFQANSDGTNKDYNYVIFKLSEIKPNVCDGTWYEMKLSRSKTTMEIVIENHGYEEKTGLDNSIIDFQSSLFVGGLKQGHPVNDFIARYQLNVTEKGSFHFTLRTTVSSVSVMNLSVPFSAKYIL